MEKVKEMAAKAKVAMSSDKNTTTGTTATGATHGGTTTHIGPHSSGMANAADPRVDSDRDASRNLGAASHGPGGHTTTTTTPHNTTTGTTGTTGTTTTGPHKSDMLNKLDPRVDSDRDGSKNLGAAQYGPGGATSTTGHGTTGHTTNTGLGTTGHTTTGSTNHGPHDSNLLNKADPRVDSDRDASRNLGAGSHGTTGLGTTGHTTGHTTTGLGTTGTTGYTTTGSTNYGPHDSNLLNKADPRVDSDRDGSRNVGAGSHGTTGMGTTGMGTTGMGTTGMGTTGLGTTGLGTTGHTTTGHTTTGHGTTGLGTTGHTTTTDSTNAGPHSSNLLNKLDPRVDSDRDGSRKVGGSGGAL